MKINKGEVEVLGRINGMGERDLEGSYAAVRVSDAHYAGTVVISEQQAIDLAKAVARDWPEQFEVRDLLQHYQQILGEWMEDIRTAAGRPGDGVVADAHVLDVLEKAEANMRRVDALLGKA